MRRPELRSLRLRLLVGLLVTLLPLAMVGAFIDYRTAQSLLRESHDRALASTAIGLAARLETDRDGDLPAHLVASVRASSRLRGSEGLVYLVQDDKGQRLGGDARLAALIKPGQNPNPSYQTVDFLGQPMRAATYHYAGPDGRADIIVAEGLGKRSVQAARVLLQALVTNLLMTLGMMAAALAAVGLALKPLDALGERVESHPVQTLRPMPLRGLPTETRPLVRAINRLTARLRRTIQARQAFIDNTAHQLRTPLASLQAQMTLLAREPLAAPVRTRVDELQSQVQRLAHLAHQMLLLSRASHTSTQALAPEPVALADLLQQVATACLDAAVAKGTDLGFEPAPAVVQGLPWMLRELLVNLVDNAIRHSPGGTTVTVRCGQAPGGAYLEVEDSGPGIAAADRARVFGRHVRLAEDQVSGSGLGLAIVRQIAEKHRAQVTLGEGAQGQGLRVRVTFDNGPAGAATA